MGYGTVFVCNNEGLKRSRECLLAKKPMTKTGVGGAGWQKELGLKVHFNYRIHYMASSVSTMRRSRVYLEVPQRNAGLIDPHSLHIFYVWLSGITCAK